MPSADAIWRLVSWLRPSAAALPAGVMMVNLDHFKRVNDTHGHLAGIHVLEAVGEPLQAEVRDYDVVGRFGGEEFAVVAAAGSVPHRQTPDPERSRRVKADYLVQS